MSPLHSRRHFLATAGLAAIAGCARREVAGGCPGLGRRVQFIVPFPAGGGFDLLARLLKPSLDAALGTQMVVANEPGAGGMIAARKLRDASPDGSMLGLMSAPGLMTAALSSDQPTPHPARDVDLIVRIERRRNALFTAANSGLHSMDDVFARQRERPLLMGISGIASTDVVVTAVLEDLLDLRLSFVTGYPGQQEQTLAALRGEVDLFTGTLDSLQDAVEVGDVRTLLRIADGTPADNAIFNTVEWLAGADGWAARRAVARGLAPEPAIDDAHLLVNLMGCGTVIAVPRGLPPDRLACVRERVLAAGRAPDFRARVEAARRWTVRAAGWEEALADILAAEVAVERFAPLTRGLTERIR